MGHNINLKIYEASAGSGKTTKLASEYITQLFKSFKPLFRDNSPDKTYTDKNLEEFRKTLSSILAVTFTNLASEQMGERILDYLYKFREIENYKTDVVEKVFREVSDKSGVRPEDIKKWSSFFLDFIITCYSDFKATTIDSFSATLVKVLSPEIDGITPDFKIRESFGENLKELIRRFLEDKVREDWPEVELSLINLSEIESKNNYNYDNLLTDKIYQIFEKFKDLKKIDVTELNKDLDMFSEEIQKTSEPLFGFIEKNSGGINKKKISENILEKLGELGKAKKRELKSKVPFFAEKTICRDNSQDLLNTGYKNLDSEFEEYLKAFRFAVGKFVFCLNKLKIAHFANLTVEFSEVFDSRKKDVVYLYEISNILKEKLNVESMPYLYLKLSEKYLRFLIDEFQDTSSRQLDVLVPIASNAILSEKDQSSLFIVGDQKQAIYFWRGVQMGMMDEDKIVNDFELKDALGKNRGSIKNSLECNFRSDRTLVEFFNDFWKKENMEGLDSYALEKTFEKSFADVNQKPARRDMVSGYVEIKKIDAPDKETIFEEIFMTVEKIKAKGWRDGDIAILLRNKSYIKDLFDFLTKKGLECITDESTYLLSSPLVAEIISFMKFLDFPPDDLSFIEFARSNLLKKAAESVNLDYKYEDSVYFKAEGSFYTIFREKYFQVWKIFVEPFFNSVGFMTAYDVYEDIIYKFKVEENFPGSSFFTIKLGEILHDLEVSNKTSISSFLSFIYENGDSEADFKIDIPKDEDKIKISTIHSSKGLEFENVILDVSEKLVKRFDAIYSTGGHLIKIPKEEAKVDVCMFKTYIEETRKGNTGELNLLYVAMTRAKHGLFMIGDKTTKNAEKKIPGKLMKFQDIVFANRSIKFENDVYSSGEMSFKIEKDENKESVELTNVPKRKSVNEIKDAYLVYESGKAKSASQKRGDAIHNALSLLGVYKDKNDFKNALSEALDLNLLSEEERRLLEDFFLEESVVKYYVGDFPALNEAEFISGSGDIMRPDRIAKMRDCVWIIDYKTGKEYESEHRKQLEKYRENLKKVYAGLEIKACLLYLDKKEMVYVES
ncbi:UvrD-helicase domain-containing protein [candidate division WOR-3 bacterium]|nr:UvrD-helicase domain-containing protein [candidate division WOR-3 bacterium]